MQPASTQSKCLYFFTSDFVFLLQKKSGFDWLSVVHFSLPNWTSRWHEIALLFYRVWINGYRVLLSLSGWHWLVPGLTGFGRVLLGFTGFYSVLQGFAGFCWVLLGFTGFYWVLLGFTGFYWVFTRFSEFDRIFNES